VYSASAGTSTSQQQEQKYQYQYPVLSQTRGEDRQSIPHWAREPAQQPQPTHRPSSAAQSHGVVIDARDLEQAPVNGKVIIDVDLYDKPMEDPPPRYSWTD